MVRVTGYKLNSELLRWLREHSVPMERCSSDNKYDTYRRTCWRLHDRLSERDIVRLIMAFNTGIATKELAKRFSINVKSVRKLLLEYEVKQLARLDMAS